MWALKKWCVTKVAHCMFCCTLLYVHSSIAIILMGKRELVALLNLSSWCLAMVERLFLAVPRVICGLWLWYFLIVLTYYSYYLSVRSSSLEIDHSRYLPLKTRGINYTETYIKVSKKAKIRNRSNQVPHPIQGTTWESDRITKMCNTQMCQEVSPFSAGDHKAAINRQESMANTKHK